MKFSKKVVALIISLNIPFTAVVLILTYLDKHVSEQLIRSWFQFTGVELVAVAMIKVAEVVKGRG